jgi:hypothetical protein
VYWRTKQVVFSQAFMNAVLAAFNVRPAASLIGAGKLRLSHDPAFNPQPSSTIASLAANETNFSGYPAGGAALVLVPGVNLTPIIQAGIATAVFEAFTAAPFVADTITGWWCDDGVNLVAGEAFGPGNAVPIGAPGDFLQLDAILPIRMMELAS